MLYYVWLTCGCGYVMCGCGYVRCVCDYVRCGCGYVRCGNILVVFVVMLMFPGVT